MLFLFEFELLLTHLRPETDCAMVVRMKVYRSRQHQPLRRVWSASRLPGTGFYPAPICAGIPESVPNGRKRSCSTKKCTCPVYWWPWWCTRQNPPDTPREYPARRNRNRTPCGSGARSEELYHCGTIPPMDRIAIIGHLLDDCHFRCQLKPFLVGKWVGL